MKKNLILGVLILLLSLLCACGKSEEARKIEDDIDTLASSVLNVAEPTAELLNDVKPQLTEIRNAYEALEPKIQGTVENYETLVNIEQFVTDSEYVYVEKMIESINDVIHDVAEATVDQIEEGKERVGEVRSEFDLLTPQMQEKVSNYSDLLDAEQRLFDAEHLIISNILWFLNIDCDYASSDVLEIWGNVGTDSFVSSYNCASFFPDGTLSVADYVEIYETTESDLKIVLWEAARGLCPEYVNNLQITDAHAIISECAQFCTNISNAEECITVLHDMVTQFKETYEETKHSEVEAIFDWWIESKLYADLVLSPEGSYSSYSSAVENYRVNIARYAETAKTK